MNPTIEQFKEQYIEALQEAITRHPDIQPFNAHERAETMIAYWSKGAQCDWYRDNPILKRVGKALGLSTSVLFRQWLETYQPSEGRPV